MENLVFQEWYQHLPMQQQSVLVLACRGPDGVAKFHPTKLIVCRYRASVLKAAYVGRALRIDEGEHTTFMSLIGFSNEVAWRQLTLEFFNHVDEIEHHYLLHLTHGAEIIGYHHPHELFRKRWLGFYEQCCSSMHMNPETKLQLDGRLNDHDRKYWDV